MNKILEKEVQDSNELSDYITKEQFEIHNKALDNLLLLSNRLCEIKSQCEFISSSSQFNQTIPFNSQHYNQFIS